MWRDDLKLAEEKEKKTKKAAAKKEAKPKTAAKKPAAKAVAKPIVESKAKTSAETASTKAKSAAKPKSEPKQPAIIAEAKPKEPPKTKKAAKSGEYVPRMKVNYVEKVVPYMIEKFNYVNPNMVPRLEKISINTRVGKAKEDPKDLEAALDDVSTIAGQKAVVTRAKKAIANFKIREGDPVGGRVTIRGRRMYEFLDRMISIAIPRVRDFNGLRQKSFDGFGNYSFGVKEQIIFPEIDYDKVDKIRGMDITIVTTAKSDEEGYELLSAFGMPFRVDITENQGT